MAANKKTLYEILGVAPTATIAEIKATHRRLSFEIMNGKLGLSRDDGEYRLQLLDVALKTLADQDSREAYDASLAPPPPPGLSLLPVKSPASESRALQLAADVVEGNSNMAVAKMDYQLRIQAISTTAKATGKAARTILRTIIGLAVLAAVIKVGQAALTARQAGVRTPQMILAEEKLIIQRYYKEHGIRPGSRAEAEALEREHRRNEHELRQVQFAEERREDELNRLAEEGRYIGARVHEDMVRAQEQIRYEDMQRKLEMQRLRDSQGREDSSQEEPGE